MKGRSTVFGGQSASVRAARNWRAELDVIKVAKDELRDYGNMMTPYERETIGRSLKEAIEQARGAIHAGAIAEFEAAVQRVLGVQESFWRARSAESARWEAGRLANEMRLAQILYERAAAQRRDVFDPSVPSAVDEIERVYREAVESEDLYKRRAAAEALGSIQLVSAEHEDKTRLNILKKRALRDLAAVRLTPEILQAKADKEEALNGLQVAMAELIEIGKTIDGFDPSGVFASGELAKALKRVKINRENGELEYLESDDPEVTGVFFKSDESDMTFGG